MSTRIALATAAEFPDLDEDGASLIAALAALGVDAEPAIWTDDAADWASYDAVVVRSTWDYFRRRDDFVAWADRVEAVTRLANRAEVLRWNTEKTYLRELAAAGLPVVETQWLDPGDTFAPPDHAEYVVKPAVSAGSNDTNRYLAGVHDELATEHAERLLRAGKVVMVQPYLRDVDTAGETALLFFGGRFSHAIRKAALLEPAMAAPEATYRPETITPREAAPAERAVADQVLDVVADLKGWPRQDLTYARVDLVPGPDGSPTLLELELAEPSMFLTGNPGAAERFAEAIAGLGGARP